MSEFEIKFKKITFYFENIFEFKNKEDSLDDFEFKIEDSLKLSLSLKTKKYLEKIVIKYEILKPENFMFFRNGFSSWSPSFFIHKEQKFRLPPIKVLKYHYLNPKEPDEKVSYSFTILKGSNYLLIYPEKTNFLTYFYLEDNELNIVFEVDKLVFGKVDFPKIIFEEKDKVVLNNDFNQKFYGWTSWYYYYRKIDRDAILKNIEYIDKLPIKLDFFQIDDGWQDSIGDWNESLNFKNSLKMISEKIKEKGVKPGIWLAPFVIEKSSKVFKDKSKLILKNKSGNLVKAGFNPLWSGYFYTFDITKEDFLDYILEKLINLKNIGFELFKLDFLYAGFLSFITKRETESILDRFVYIMKRIKEELKDSIILACGAPYILVDNIYDILRIGPDTKDGWKDLFTRLIGFSGNVEAFNSLRNTLLRPLVTKRFFLSDPDVVFLKPKNLGRFEKETILIVDYFLSNIIFFSDPLFNLNSEDFSFLLKLKEIRDYYILDFDFKDYLFKYKISSKDGFIELFVNLSDKKFEIEKNGNELFKKREDKIIYPHETRVFILK